MSSQPSNSASTLGPDRLSQYKMPSYKQPSYKQPTYRRLGRSKSPQKAAPLPSSMQMYANINSKAYDETKVDPNEKKVAAGVATGVIGTLVGGPIVGVALGAGAVYANNQKGLLGDASRAMSEVALEARNRVFALDQKYQITKTAGEKSQEVIKMTRELDGLKVIDRSKDAVVGSVMGSVTAADQFLRQHKVLERSTQTATTAAQWATDRLKIERERFLREAEKIMPSSEKSKVGVEMLKPVMEESEISFKADASDDPLQSEPLSSGGSNDNSKL
jgi:hypothetical protein